MINFGNEDQQCKLIEVLSYVDFRYKNYKIYEKNEELIKNNLTPYGCKNVVELLAEITTNAILSGVKEDKEFAQIVLAFVYCWIDYVLKNTDTESFNKSLKPEKYIKDYYEDIIKCIKNNCNKLTHDIEYKKVRFDYNNAYFTITLTNDELENIKKSGNISELALKYSRRIKFYDKLEYCYVDIISYRKIGLKTFILKNDYKNCKSKNSQDVYVKPIIIENSEIEGNVKKIEIFLQDFYKFLYKEYDENLSKFTIFEKMQLIVFFYKLLNEKIENENYITIKGQNPLLCIAINGIINDILKTNLYNNFKNDSEKILSDEKLKELSDINKINEIDRNSTRIYVTKKYFNDIKEDKLKKNDNIDRNFLIQKKIGEDYFYLNNSEFEKTKYEKFPEQCSKISLDKEKKDLMGKKRYFNGTCSDFDRKYEKFMDNDKEINESSKENFQDIVKINFIDIFENYCRDYLSELYSYKINNEYHEIIKKNIPVNYDINGIKELLTKMIENKILINNMKKNYNEFINNYENYDKTAIYDQNIINELKNKITKLKECLLKEIDELKEKLSDFDKFFYDKMINIRKFIVSYIPIIYDRISKKEKSKNFIEYFNNYFCTNYPLIDDEK